MASSAATGRIPNVWRLTPQGEEVVPLSSDRGALVSSVSKKDTP
jgi:hypothetical protein